MEFIGVVGSKIGPTSTPEHFEERVIWWRVKKSFKWSGVMQERSREPVDEIASSKKRIIPMFKREMSMG